MVWAMVFAAGAALLAAFTIAVVIRTYTPLPKWDHWAEIAWLKNYYAGQWHISDLWRQHNEHRILFPRLFLLADWFLFRGTNVFLLFSILLLQAGHAWIFIREVRDWKSLSREVRLTAIAIIVVLFFSGANLENFTWPFQISFILAFYAGTVSIYALIRYAEERGENAVAAAVWLAVSAGSGIVATHSLSNGLFIWPVILLAGIALRLPRPMLLLVGILSGLVGFQYFSGYHLIAGHTNAFEALRQPIGILGFVGAYLALPLTKIDHGVGVFAGLMLLGSYTWIAFRILRRRVWSRLTLLNLGVMLYIIAGAFVTALGRMSVAPPEAALRYTTPVCIFWACGFLLALSESEGFPQRSVASAVTLSVAITSLIVTIVPLHLDNAFKTLRSAGGIREAELALRVNVYANVQVAEIYPDPAFVLGLLDVLREHHRSIFAGSPILVGQPLGPDYQVVSRNRCGGTWEFTAVFDNGDTSGESATGWAWDNAANRRPQMVLLLDEAQVVRGLAGVTRVRQDVAFALHKDSMVSSGWFGFAKRVPGDPSYRAYALLNDGRSVCQLNNAAEIPKSLFTVVRHGQWFIDSNRSGSWEPEDRRLLFGLEGDIPVSGDWDGSGVIRAGVFRKGEWFLDWNNNGRWDEGDRQFVFGLPGDLPVVGDWGHTGVSKVGVFRNGTWLLDWNGEQRVGVGMRMFPFGVTGDIPVAGDWDGSGVTRIGVYRQGVWYLDVNGDFKLDSRDKVAMFGLPTDQPVTGDWNGLGVTNIGVFRNGKWILDSDGSGSWDSRDAVIPFGMPGDAAVLWK
jgi:hypothetical protein